MHLVQFASRSSVSTFSMDRVDILTEPVIVSMSSEESGLSVSVSENRCIISQTDNVLAAAPMSRFASSIGDFMFIAPRLDDAEPTLRLALGPHEDGARALCQDNQITYVDGVEDLQMNNDPRWIVNAVVTIVPPGQDAAAESGTAATHSQSWSNMHLYHISPDSPVDILDTSVWGYDFLSNFEDAGAVVDGVNPGDNRIILSNCTENLERFPSFRYSIFTYVDPARTQLEKALDLIVMPAEYTTPMQNGRCYLNLRSGGRRHTQVTEQNVFGLNIFKNTNIHFDSVNRRIGFGDPIE